MARESLDEYRFEASEVSTAETRFWWLGRGAASGTAASLDQFTNYFTLRAGMIVRAHAFVSREQAFEAAGLRE